jgi:hypothetical protein
MIWASNLLASFGVFCRLGSWLLVTDLTTTRRNGRDRALMLVEAFVPTGDRSWPHQHSGERIRAVSASAPDLRRHASDNKSS